MRPAMTCIFRCAEDLRSCDVAANGDFLMIENFVRPPLSPHINIILNWFEELKQRVPTGR